MKMALLQIRLNSKSRAANVQELNAAIDRAAGTSPALDVVVLPGACDTGSAPRRGWSEAGLQGVKESIAFKAREWGVFIAAGVHLAHGHALEPCAVLFDPDGDIVVRSVASVAGVRSESIRPVEPWSSAIGDVGVLEPTITGPLEERVRVSEQGAMIAVPVCRSAMGRMQRTVDANMALLRNGATTGHGIYWAVVAAAGDEDMPTGESVLTTFLRGPDGAVLAAASGPDETIVYADVAMT